MSMKIESSDYPKIFVDADDMSNKAQRIYKGLNKAVLFILFVATIMVSIDDHIVSEFKYWHLSTGVLFLVASLLLVCLFYIKPERKWYLGRAVAESIKSISWKFMMSAEPFDADDNKNNEALFIKRLNEIYKKANENGALLKSISGNTEPISRVLKHVRSLTYIEKKSIYLENRLQEQIEWYSGSATTNKNRANILLFGVISLQVVTAGYLIFFSNSFHFSNIPEITIFIVTAILALIEMNKYRELKESYLYTANELIYIRNRVSIINSDLELNEFVSDAELAISREHTMWLARREN